MVLQSQLFRGDAKLEAAAVSDPAHIVQGAVGPHVSKLQLALVLVDAAAISQDGIYGPRTAAAVSAFKQKRNILNFQGKIDNIVGKKTIAQLDREILALEGGFVPPPPIPKRPIPRPTPVPPTPAPSQPAPEVVLEFGSTNWRFSFFGNKGFTGKGIYRLFIASTEIQDSEQFDIDEVGSSGDLLAGFKGECGGTFTTTKKVQAQRFRSAACDFNLGKLLASNLLQGGMRLLLIGDDQLSGFLPLQNLRDETFGTSVTSGNLRVQGRVRGRR
jgi:hypothetical protein